MVATQSEETVVLDLDGTSVTMLGGDVELIEDAWVEAIEDDVVDFDDEDEPEDWRAQPTAEPELTPVPYRQRAADPELDALVTWFVHELCHAPRRPGGVRGSSSRVGRR